MDVKTYLVHCPHGTSNKFINDEMSSNHDSFDSPVVWFDMKNRNEEAEKEKNSWKQVIHSKTEIQKNLVKRHVL